MKTDNEKLMIWSDDFDIEESIKFISEDYPELSREAAIELANDMHYEDLEYEKDNLNISLEGKIVQIADLGLWDGRHTAIARMRTNNISDIFQSEYSPQWYVENGELRCTEVHHDGTNYIYYREILDEDAFDDLIPEILAKTCDQSALDACTRSLAPNVCDVYGWAM